MANFTPYFSPWWKQNKMAGDRYLLSISMVYNFNRDRFSITWLVKYHPVMLWLWKMLWMSSTWGSHYDNCFILYYTLSHPENERDVTERTQEYTLQYASLLRQSRCSFLNAWEKTHRLRTRWQACSTGIRADVTVVLEVRQSIDVLYHHMVLCVIEPWTCVKEKPPVSIISSFEFYMFKGQECIEGLKPDP